MMMPAAMCVQHEHVPGETVKFLGGASAYEEELSSLMLLNCSRCTLRWLRRPRAWNCTVSTG